MVKRDDDTFKTKRNIKSCGCGSTGSLMIKIYICDRYNGNKAFDIKKGMKISFTLR